LVLPSTAYTFKGKGRGKGGEMTQTLYAHMNIIKKGKKKEEGVEEEVD
jgi:hypothetical protein